MTEEQGLIEAEKRIQNWEERGVVSAILDLSNLGLKHLPSSLSKLHRLKKLKIGQSDSKFSIAINEINDLSPLESLHQLTYLDFAYNKVSDLSPISSLTKLTYLKFSANQVNDLSPISSLTKLTYLKFSANQVNDLSPISSLTQLNFLYFSGNQVSDLSAISSLTQLPNLDFSNNQVSDLSPIKNIINELRNFDFNGNPITNPPPQIWKQGLSAIQTYFSNLVEATASFREIKVLLLGLGSAGKTHLCHALCNSALEDIPDDTLWSRSTLGVDIHKLSWINNQQEGRPEYTINFWDFAGQEVNYGIHELFFSENSIYVIVLDSRAEHRAEYWLKLIEHLAGKNSKALIVFTKADELYSGDDKTIVERKIGFIELCQKYPFLEHSSFLVSAKQNKNIQEFKAHLLNMVETHPQVNLEFSENYLAVKEKIDTWVEQNNVLLEEVVFSEICEQNQLKKEEEKRLMLNLLVMMGSITYLDNPELNKLHILNPGWLTKGVYLILKESELTNGIIEEKDIFRLFELTNNSNEFPFKYQKSQIYYLIQMMIMRFQALPMENAQLLIPSAISKGRVLNLQYSRENCLRLHYQYELLPDGLFPKLIAQFYRLSDKNSYDYNKIKISKPTNQQINALIECDRDKKLICIFISGAAPDNGHFLDSIRDNFSLIHRAYQNKDSPNFYQEHFFSREDTNGIKPFTYEDLMWIIKNSNPNDYPVAELRKNINVLDILGVYHLENNQPYEKDNDIYFSKGKIINHGTMNLQIGNDNQMIDKQLILNPERRRNLSDIQADVNALIQTIEQIKGVDNHQELKAQLNELADAVIDINATENDTIGSEKTSKFKKVLDGAKKVFKGVVEKLDKLNQATTGVDDLIKTDERIINIYEWIEKISSWIS